MSVPLFQPKFNSNSWHARLHRLVYDEDPEYHRYTKRISICRYFWSTVLAAFLFGVFVVVYPFYWVGKKLKANVSISHATKERLELGAAVFVFGVIIVGAAFLVFAAFLYAWWLPFTFLGAGTSIFIVAWGLVELYARYKYSTVWNWLHEGYNRLYRRYLRWWGDFEAEKPKPVKPKKQSSVTWSYLRAKKGQVCPFVEWT